MTLREQLQEELRNLEGKNKLRSRQIIKILNECVCRNCSKKYDRLKARGDWTGFCSAKCQHVKAKALGFRKGMTEYQVLKMAACIGDVYTTN